MRLPRFRVRTLMVGVIVAGPLLALAITVFAISVPIEVFAALFGVILCATGPAAIAWYIMEPSPLRRRVCTRVLAAFGTGALLLGGPLLFGVWLFSAHGLSNSAQAALHPGLTRDEVLRIAGAPASDNGQTWGYVRQSWCRFTVNFGADGRVRDIDHDH